MPFWVLSFQYLQECINFELNIAGKISNFVSLYKTQSQNQGKFEKFMENLELNLERLCQNNLFLIVLIGVSMPNQKIDTFMTNQVLKEMQLKM